MRETESIYTAPEMVGKSYRHMRTTYTYSHSCGDIHFWISERIGNAHYIRQTQA